MKKQHRRNRLQLLLLLFLCLGCLSAATGTTFARYQSEKKESLQFEVREPSQVQLGELNWIVDEKTGKASLTFSVANGSDEKNYSSKDQSVKLRMLGSLTLAETGAIPQLTVTYEDKKSVKTAAAEGSYITEGSALYHSYGPGCLYKFYETTAEGEKELTWELPGGELSEITLTVQTEGDASGIFGVLQPLIIAEPTVTADAVLITPAKEITSNCLVKETDAPRTVLLGEADLENRSEVKIPFWLLSSGADAEVKLNWYVEEGQAEYFDVALKLRDGSEEGDKELEQGVDLTLPKNVSQKLTLSVKPTEKAATDVHEEMAVKIYVTAGESLTGTFQILLPKTVEAAEEEEEPETPATPTEPETPEDSEAPTESETPEDSGTPTEPENQEESDTSVTSLELETQEVSEPSLELETQEVSEPSLELETQEVSEPSVELETQEVSEPSLELETQEVSEPSVEPETQETSSYKLETIPDFDIHQQLPVIMTFEGAVTSARLGLQKTEGESTAFTALPDYTIFSTDGGASYYMVYGDYVHEFEPETSSVSLLLDFRYTKLAQDEKLTLAMEAYSGEELQGTCTADTAAGITKDWQEGEILNFENTLEFAFPKEWKDIAVPTYTVEYLTMTEQGLQCIPVELSENGLQGTYEKEENTYGLVLALGEQFTQPGTYRCSVSWSYHGLCYDTEKIKFFVNCSGWVAPDVNGSEVSDDE